jgi:hypothetical protein
MIAKFCDFQEFQSEKLANLYKQSAISKIYRNGLNTQANESVFISFTGRINIFELTRRYQLLVGSVCRVSQ